MGRYIPKTLWKTVTKMTEPNSLVGADSVRRGNIHKLWLEKFRVTIRKNFIARRVQQQLSRSPREFLLKLFEVFKFSDRKTWLTNQMLAKIFLSAGVWTKEI